MKNSIAVIGLGNMGSAIADALISKGHQVTVWNRSPDKASNLVTSGAILADSPFDALNSSDVVLVCVSNASACEEIFSAEGFAGKLKNKTLIQYSTMSPKESVDFAAWAEKANAGYLDGSILGLPQGVREGTPKILYSGTENLFYQVQPVLEALGEPVWLGNKHGTAFMADKVVYAQYYGIHFVYLLVAALGQSAGISVENLKMLIGGGDRWKIRGEMIDSALDMASSRDYAGNECALDVHLDAFKHAVQLSEDTGVGVEFMRMVAQAMNEAIEKGHAKDELPSIFETFCDDKT